MTSITSTQDNLQVPSELKYFQQWVNYIFVSRPGNKITKPPMNPNVDPRRPLKERLATPTDPQTWSSFEQALATLASSPNYKGIGFVLTAHDNICAIDLDHCVNPTTGEIAPWAQHIITMMNSYTEISPSKTGIHIFVRASLTQLAHDLQLNTIRHKYTNIELYDRERYLTITGNHIITTPTTIEPRQTHIQEFYTTFFPQHPQEKTPSKPPQTTLLDDRLLINKAMSAKNNLFQQLWNGDLTGFYKADQDIDYSKADLALCGSLAYWTGKDATRMDRLFRQSALFRPEKWDRPARGGETYGEGTIREACERCHSTYDPNWKSPNWLPYEEYIAKQTFPQTDTTQRRREAQS